MSRANNFKVNYYVMLDATGSYHLFADSQKLKTGTSTQLGLGAGEYNLRLWQLGKTLLHHFFLKRMLAFALISPLEIN